MTVMTAITMQRSQMYLPTHHLTRLAAYARSRKTTQSALMREALDLYLGQQAPLDKKAALGELFGAWRDMPEGPSIRELRSEERSF
jgi:hypothetical protein